MLKKEILSMFSRYLSVGVINTAIHWVVFFILYFCGLGQFISNIVAFTVSVTFSFMVNACFTFRKKATSSRYIYYIAFMGGLAAMTGYISDNIAISPIVTLVMFSIISLFVGFLYSKFFVFRT